MKIVIYTMVFRPKKEFTSLAEKLGFSDIRDPEFVRDERVVKFVEERLTTSYNIYLGEPSEAYYSGFAGFAQVVEVDPTRTWRLRANYGVCIGYQEVEYVSVTTDSNGFTTVKEIR